MKIIVLIASALITTLASSNEPIYPDQVIWGMYCGECVINCSTMRKIEHSMLSIDTSGQFFKSTPFNYVFSGKQEPDHEFKKYQWLLKEPLPSIISKDKIIFGDPDGYDQCGYYVDYRVNQKEFKVLIDPDKVPDRLEGLVRKLFFNRVVN